ncbi:MAG: urate hydroxylase PuuD [Planktomarina sp.]
MYDFAVFWSWAEFAIRWLHVVTAIAWIGSSFYFIALDLGLNRNILGPADGEEWQVHGGGFYHIQKYLVAPERLPNDLVWFKWESYSTWLSGAALLMVVYWIGGELYLIDPAKADLTLWQAALVSAGSLAAGWIIYNLMCKSPLAEHPTALMVVLFAILVIVSWGYAQVFTGRGALLHVGAFTATIMTANVFFIIIPNQKIVVADLKAGRTLDAKYGKIAKLRSTHNNYLTLPVIFLMLSNHYPLAFGTEYAWIIAALVFLMGVSIRHYFNTMHAKKGRPNWTWLVTALIFIALIWLSSKPMEENQTVTLSAAQERFIQADGFEAAHDIMQTRCVMCHMTEPAWEGLAFAPKGVLLETPEDTARYAKAIYVQSGLSHAMPPANLTDMEDDERAQIVAWYQNAVK